MGKTGTREHECEAVPLILWAKCSWCQLETALVYFTVVRVLQWYRWSHRDREATGYLTGALNSNEQVTRCCAEQLQPNSSLSPYLSIETLKSDHSQSSQRTGVESGKVGSGLLPISAQ